MTCMEELLKQDKWNWKLLLLSVEGVLIAFFIWKTQCRGGLLALLFIGSMFISRMIRQRKNKSYICKAIGMIVLFIVLFVPIWQSVNRITFHLSEKLGTVVTFETDVQNLEACEQNSFWGLQLQVYAADSKLIQKFDSKSLDAMLSGRITIWKAYIRHMNLWGHANKEIIGKNQIYAHNAMIGIGYRYGVLALIPYVIMWCLVIGKAVKYMILNGNRKFAFLPFGLCIGYVMLSMTDALEQPWRDIIWIMAYFVMGILFIDDEQHMVEKGTLILQSM